MAAHRIKSRRFQFVPPFEQMGIVGHVKHGRVTHRPDLLGRLATPIHQHRATAVDSPGDLGVPPIAENRCGAGVGIDGGEVLRVQGEGSLRLVEFRHGMEEKGAARFGERAFGPAEHQSTELETRVDIGKKNFLVLEIQQRGQPPRGGDAFEKGAGTLVRGDPGRREQPYDALVIHQALRPFHEQRIQVHVAAGQQRILAAVPRDPGGGLSPVPGLLVLQPQTIARFFQLTDQPLAVSGADGVGDLRLARGEPFHFLELHPIPRRIADDGVETALRLAAVQMTPNRGKRDGPGQETFLLGQFAGSPQQFPNRPHLVAGGVPGHHRTGVDDVDDIPEPPRRQIGPAALSNRIIRGQPA